ALLEMMDFKVSFDPGLDLFQLKRLRNVIDSATLESLHFVLSFAQCAKEDDRNLSKIRVSFKTLADLITVHSGMLMSNSTRSGGRCVADASASRPRGKRRTS